VSLPHLVSIEVRLAVTARVQEEQASAEVHRYPDWLLYALLYRPELLITQGVGGDRQSLEFEK
jgi:hypothetical protein